MMPDNPAFGALGMPPPPDEKLAPKQQLLLVLIPNTTAHVVLVLGKAEEGPRLSFAFMREGGEGEIQKLLAASFNKIIDGLKTDRPPRLLLFVLLLSRHFRLIVPASSTPHMISSAPSHPHASPLWGRHTSSLSKPSYLACGCRSY